MQTHESFDSLHGLAHRYCLVVWRDCDLITPVISTPIALEVEDKLRGGDDQRRLAINTYIT